MDMFELSYLAVVVLGFLAVAVPGYWLLSGWWQDAQEQGWFAPSKREKRDDQPVTTGERGTA